MPIDLEALANLIEAAPSKDEGPAPPQPPAPTGQEIRALWFRTPPRPLPPEVLKRVGAVPEVHGLDGCWNIVGNRLSSRELAALLVALGEVNGEGLASSWSSPSSPGAQRAS